MNKIKFTFVKENFDEFITYLKELTKIGDTIKIKIDDKNIMLYTMLGSSSILAFKNYLLDTSKYLEYSGDLDFTLDTIFVNSKKLVKNLSFLSKSDKITLEVTYKESIDDEKKMVSRNVVFSSGKMNIRWAIGEHYEIRDITNDALKVRLNLDNSKLSFRVKNDDFDDIKSLAKINGDNLININIVSGDVQLSEKMSWELHVDTIDYPYNDSFILNKKFLSSIEDSDDVIFHLFENFMLIKTDCSNLMLSFEQSFENE